MHQDALLPEYADGQEYQQKEKHHTGQDSDDDFPLDSFRRRIKFFHVDQVKETATSDNQKTATAIVKSWKRL